MIRYFLPYGTWFINVAVHGAQVLVGIAQSGRFGQYDCEFQAYFEQYDERVDGRAETAVTAVKRRGKTPC